MDISLVLANVLGGLSLLVGLSALNKKSIASLMSEFENNRGLFWFTGLVTFLIGVTSVSLYSVWGADWRVIITILGWLILIKGVLITLFPNFMLSMYRNIKPNGVVVLAGVVLVIIGVILLYFGVTA